MPAIKQVVLQFRGSTCPVCQGAVTYVHHEVSGLWQAPEEGQAGCKEFRAVRAWS